MGPHRDDAAGCGDLPAPRLSSAGARFSILICRMSPSIHCTRNRFRHPILRFDIFDAHRVHPGYTKPVESPACCQGFCLFAGGIRNVLPRGLPNNVRFFRQRRFSRCCFYRVDVQTAQSRRHPLRLQQLHLSMANEPRGFSWRAARSTL